MGRDFQHSFKYKFVTSPPSILSYLIHSPQHPLESAAMLLPYQETHAPSIQPLAAILNFFRETTENVSLVGPTRITYHNSISSRWMPAAVCLLATGAQEIHPGPSCLFRKHSRCFTSCFVCEGGNVFCGAVEIKREKKEKGGCNIAGGQPRGLRAHCGAVGLLFKTFKLRWL